MGIHSKFCSGEGGHDGFAWGTDNFLPSGWNGAIVWICAVHSIDNTDVVTAEQRLHRAQAFSSFPTAGLLRRLAVPQRLGEDTARTGDLS